MNLDNLQTSLLHPSGKPMVQLGGLCWGEPRTVGDVTTELKWVGGQPVMILYKRVLGNNTPAFMIEMKDAHRFALSNGHATRELLTEYAQLAAEALNSEHDKATIHRITTAILDGIPDLLSMPPEPKESELANRPSSGNDELTIKINDQVIAEVQV